MADLIKSQAGSLSSLSEDAIGKLAHGDLSGLKPAELASYYAGVCRSVGLNPLTTPFQLIKLNGRLVMYARKEATEQLRGKYGVSTEIVGRETRNDCFIVTARAKAADGRHDEALGAVPVKGLVGENYANAIMKAETKAKRRATLSLFGLGVMDETEIESVGPVERVSIPVEDLRVASIQPEPQPEAKDSEPLEGELISAKPAAAPASKPSTGNAVVDGLLESILNYKERNFYPPIAGRWLAKHKLAKVSAGTEGQLTALLTDLQQRAEQQDAAAQKAPSHPDAAPPAE